MKRFLVCLSFVLATIPIQAQVFPTKREVQFSLPELSIRDSAFMGSLFETLQSSARSQPREFEEYNYVYVDISKGTNSEIEVTATSAPTLSNIKEGGYLEYNGKTFFIRGDLADRFFSKGSRRKKFSGVYPYMIDDRELVWLLNYTDGVWKLGMYPDRWGIADAREKDRYKSVVSDSNNYRWVPVSGKDEAPLLIDISSEVRPIKAVIPCKCVQDTLKVGIYALVYFDGAVSDTTRILHPRKVYLTEISYQFGVPKFTPINPDPTLEKRYPVIMAYTSDGVKIVPITSEHANTPYDQCLWDTCSAKLMEWMKYQPYSNFYQRENLRPGAEAVRFNYTILLIPE